MTAPTAEVIGVVGTGAMGQGIAQVAVQGGLVAVLLDTREGAAQAAKGAIATRLLRLVEKGKLTQDAAEAAVERLRPATSLGDLAGAGCIVEAVFEDLEVKRRLFKDLEEVVGDDCIIASNTSSIPIASIARVCRKRDRIAGFHFFNPVPLMRLVEIIRTVETSDATVERLDVLGRRMTRTPVVVKDSPGFLVNLGGRAFSTEGLRIAHEGVATPAQIDAIMRDACGFRMGPFELMDLTGIDVNFPVSGIVYDGYMQDPRLKTSPNHKALFDAGLLGRKTGQGWYAYGDEAPERPSPDHVSDAAPAAQVTLVAGDARLEAFCAEIGLAPAADDGRMPILAAPVGEDATHTAAGLGLDHTRLVCVDLAFATDKRVTLMTAPGADPAVLDRVAAAVVRSGRKVTAIKDSPGFVAQRLAAMIANLGCYMAEIGLATPSDIDVAMRLGLNYPRGPLELVDHLGAATTLRIMERLHALTGEDRYRPTLWLRRRAALGLPVHTPS